MSKLFTFCALAAFYFSFSVTSCAGTDVNVQGGVLDVEGFFGIGQNTSYFVFDFGGGPATSPGPRDSYVFGYQYDDSDTTVADALQALVAEGSGLSFDFGGTPDAGFGLFINAISFGDDSDAPDFDLDSRFWQFFNGTLSGEQVMWSGSPVGISGLPLTSEGLHQNPLTDGSFSGFRAQQFDSGEPAVPVVAIPEPSGLVLIGCVAVVGFAGRRRKG